MNVAPFGLMYEVEAWQSKKSRIFVHPGVKRKRVFKLCDKVLAHKRSAFSQVPFTGKEDAGRSEVRASHY